MNNEEIRKKVYIVANEILNKKSYVSPIELLLEMDVLKQKDYEDWRMKRIPYMERVCSKNLRKLTFIMKELKRFGKEKNLKPSFTAYMSWGKGKKIKLQFSRSGSPNIEQEYSTHYVDVGGLYKVLKNKELLDETGEVI